LNLALTLTFRTSLACRVEHAQLKKAEGQTYLELGLSFADLSQTDREQINKIIVEHLIR